MEIEDNRRLPFIGMEIIRFDHHLETCVYRKGLLLHHQSHVDNRYKRSLIKTMLNRADRLSSTAEHFNTERSKLRTMFLKLKYQVTWSKTQQSGDTALIIPIPSIPNSPLCPVHALHELFTTVSAPDSAPAFSYIAPNVELSCSSSS